MVRPAHSLTTLLKQINGRFPYRDRASDGGIGDQAHSSRTSDHNPDSNGVYHARDFDHDPDSNGLNCVTLNRELKASRDPRIKYVIFQGRIWYPSDTTGRSYTGPNAHMGHLHLSVKPGVGNQTHNWNIPMLNSTLVIIPVGSTVPQMFGLTEAQAMRLQSTLNGWYPKLTPLVVDGDLGPKTIDRIKYAQTRFGLRLIDGIPGPITLKALGLKF